MSTTTATPCANCQRLQAEVDDLRAQLGQLQAQFDQLQQQLAAARKDSSTSSKPPSSDLVKPPKPPPPPGQSKRSKGGQPGHPRHLRRLFPPELLSAEPFDYRLGVCPDCGHRLADTGFAPRIVQQVELEVVPLRIEEHRLHETCCPHCGAFPQAALPPAVQEGGLVGPRLTTLIAYLKGVCHASFSTVRKFLRDVVGLTISRGQLAKVIGKVTEALEGPYQELLESLPGQARLNVDETGHKVNGEHWWTWCFRASLYTLFKIDSTRSADVLIQVLGEEFDGVLGCDCFSAYRRYMREFGVTLQFCLAHLIRDVKFLTTLPDRRDQAYGERLRQALRRLFEVFHQREQPAPLLWRLRLEAARDEVLRQAGQDVPPSQAAQALAKRFRDYGASYFVFITTPEVEPTNNLAEQAIRFVVIDRHITQGTRSEAGNRWCERIWSVIATCAQQGKSVFGYLEAAVRAHFTGGPAPALLAAEGR
jgi:transposase